MLYSPDHRPIPPADLQRRLAQIDPHLELRWEENGVGGPGWWLIYRWAANEPRRKHILAGAMDPDADFDLYAQLPKDCPAEQAYGYLVRSFRSSGSPEAKRLLDRVSEFNRERTDAIWQPVMEEAYEMIEANSRTLFAEKYGTIPKSFRKVEGAKRGRTAKDLNQ